MALSVLLILVITAGQSFLLYEFATLRVINNEKRRKTFARILYSLMFLMLLLLLISELSRIYDILWPDYSLN